MFAKAAGGQDLATDRLVLARVCLFLCFCVFVFLCFCVCSGVYVRRCCVGLAPYHVFVHSVQVQVQVGALKQEIRGFQ